jgi:nicotinamide mononucleotide transporter
MFQALQRQLVTIGSASINSTELLGFITGAACVWMVARQNIWNWPLGILNNLFFLLLFWTTGLYADSGLQIVYITLAIYGWWLWLHGGQARATLRVSLTTKSTWTWLLPATVLATVALHLLLSRATDSTVPFWDALTTALSLAATYGQCRKLLESWWFWIAADIIYIPLYVYKGLWLTGLLYLVFLMLCIQGLRAWRRSV